MLEFLGFGRSKTEVLDAQDTLPVARKNKNLSSYAAQRRAGTHLLHAIEQFIGLEHHRAHSSSSILHQLHGAKEFGLFEHFNKDYSATPL